MGNAQDFIRNNWGAVLFVLFLVVLAMSYIAGFRITTDGIEKSGAIRVEGVPSGSYVYVDEIRRHQVAGAGTSMFITSGTHAVVVDAEGYQPWHELVSVSAGNELLLNPLLISTTLVAQDIPDTQYEQAEQTLHDALLPTRETPVVLANECAKVYVERNRILAERSDAPNCNFPEYLCTDASIAEFGVCLPTVIFGAVEEIHSVIAYPNRTDALIVASGNLAYVLELDPREPRFFAPIARDTTIRVAPWSTMSILITNNGIVRELPL